MKAAYFRDGYAVARGIIPRADIELALSELRGLFEQCLPTPQPSLFGAMQALFDQDTKAYLAALTLGTKLLSVADVLSHANARAALKELGIARPAFPSGPVLNVMAEALKIPGGYYGTGAHQDWPSIQGSLDLVTVWIPFTETKSNFPLEVIPGSHRQGLLGGHVSGSVLEIECDEAAFVPVDCGMGDAVFTSGFTVHRTGAGADDLRIAASVRFENTAEPEFIRRAYPCAQKRTVERGLMTPDFPTAEQVKKRFE